MLRKKTKYLYIYEHGDYFAYSSVKMSMVAAFCLIEEFTEFVTPCCNTTCHRHYLPYFYTNDNCESMIEDTFPELSTLLNTGTFGKPKVAGNTTKMHGHIGYITAYFLKRLMLNLQLNTDYAKQVKVG